MEEIYDEVNNAREKLKGLIEVRDSQNMDNVYDYMEGLTETEVRLILKLITYGSWKDFQYKEGDQE